MRSKQRRVPIKPETLAAIQSMMTAAIKHYGGDPSTAVITICRTGDQPTGSTRSTESTESTQRTLKTQQTKRNA